MKKLFYLILVVILTSCQSWNYTKLYYPKCVELKPIHVHLYNHYDCEWSCLELDRSNHITIDSIGLKYKTDNIGEIKKLKLVRYND